MNQRFLVLFAATVTVAVVAIRAGEVALASGGALPTAGLVISGGLAAIGLLVLIRSVYVDGQRSARRSSGSSR